MIAILQASLLALIAGYADAVGFLRFDAFAGMMTGNTILLGISLLGDEPRRALYYGAIILTFLAGVLVSRILIRLSGTPFFAGLLGAGAIAGCGWVEGFWAAPLLSFAMGAQNVSATRFRGVALNTVFLTGNLQKLGEMCLAWLWPSPSRDASPVAATPGGILLLLLVWLNYAAGAVLGAEAQAEIAWPLLPAAVLLPLVLVRAPRA
jgi:uncharacterized membrane protein YoaK (UPF0700 family)